MKFPKGRSNTVRYLLGWAETLLSDEPSNDRHLIHDWYKVLQQKELHVHLYVFHGFTVAIATCTLMDFSKAFDCVNQAILFYGVSSNLEDKVLTSMHYNG